MPAPTVDREERLALARKGADLLYQRGARRVRLFGSLARGRRQDERSDIDLAVEGLPEDLFYCTVSELLDELGVSVDLVEMERASPVLREQILRFGIELPRS